MTLARPSLRCLLPALAALLLAPGQAATQSSSEYEVKVAFIHNIAKFVEWPGDGSTLRFCVAGQDPFGDASQALQGKTVGGRVWEVVPEASHVRLRDCQVLFIATSEAGNLHRILDGVRGRPILTIGDTTGYAEQGVMVNFYVEQGKVRFEINSDAVGRSGLKFSSQLLKLARIVRDAGGAP